MRLLLIVLFLSVVASEVFYKPGKVIPNSLDDIQIIEGMVTSRRDCVSICIGTSTCKLVSAFLNDEKGISCILSAAPLAVADLMPSLDASDVTAFVRNDGYKMYGDRFYKLNPVKVDWVTAYKSCQDSDAQLLMPNTPEAITAVFDYVKYNLINTNAVWTSFIQNVPLGLSVVSGAPPGWILSNGVVVPDEMTISLAGTIACQSFKYLSLSNAYHWTYRYTLPCGSSTTNSYICEKTK